MVLSLVFMAWMSSEPPLQAGDTVAANLFMGHEELFDATNEDDAEKERLRWLIDNPFDLDVVTASELESIPGVTPSEALSVIRLRGYLHGLVSVSQIRSLERGEEILEKIEPFVRVVPRLHRHGRTLRCRVSGNSSSPFGGTTQYGHLEFDEGAIQGSATMERDAGERISDGFASGFVAVNIHSMRLSVTAGDFTVRLGQGLILWPGAAIGKGGSGISSVRKKGTGIQGYRSSSEAFFLRGIGARYDIETGAGVLRIMGWWSSRALSGRVDDAGVVTSIYEGGLFRSDAERNLRHTLPETLQGGRIEFSSWDGWSLGLNGYRSSFSRMVRQSTPGGFRGSSIGPASADMSVEIGRLLVFAEVARCGGNGAVAGLLVHPRRATVALIVRHYDPDFVAMHANGFGENGGTRNEEGVYAGMQFRPFDALACSMFVDLFSFPWRTYLKPLPSSGSEVFSEATLKVSRSLSVSLRYRRKSSEERVVATDAFGRADLLQMEQVKEQGRCSVDITPVRGLVIRSRIAVSGFHDGIHQETRGILLYTDVAIRPGTSLSARMRMTFFETDSFDNALYEYEGGVRGQYSMTSVSGRGDRWYGLLSINPSEGLVLSAKYAASARMTDPALRSEFSLQLDLQF